MTTGKLYLIPTNIAEGNFNDFFPEYNAKIINEIDCYIVEELRTARRFLRYANIEKAIDELQFFTLNEHTKHADLEEFLSPCKEGRNVGLMSEAGVPCVADPGNIVVAKAHTLGIPVVPLIGPSSILLALMASGLNGQKFTFHGYLPVDSYQREKRLKSLDQGVHKYGQTQIFIETPYRNGHLMESIVKVCQPDTKVCVAKGLTSENAFIKTMPVAKWRAFLRQEPDLMDKVPCIFLIGK